MILTAGFPAVRPKVSLIVNYPIDFKPCMIIPFTVNCDLKCVATILLLLEIPDFYLKHANIFTLFCIIQLSHLSDFCQMLAIFI